MAVKPVKFYNSTMAGAPILNGTAGSLIAVLDACLINGFNLVSLDSLVVAGGVLTGTKAGHGFVVDQVIATSASEPELIGEWTVRSITSSTFTADATGVSNVSGSGALSAKAAPAGWQKLYSGINKAVYKSNDPTNNGCVLRVDDTGTTAARIVGYETMSDVDTGSGPFPSAAQISGGGHWQKSYQANTTARGWDIFADTLRFIYAGQPSLNAYADFAHFFGQYASEKSGDGYGTLLSATATDFSQAYAQTFIGNLGGASNAGGWSPRSFTQLGSSVPMTIASFMTYATSGVFSGSDNINLPDYPSPLSGGLLISKPVVVEGVAQGGFVRSLSLPGVYHSPQKLMAFSHRDKVSNIAALPNRTLMMVSAAGNSGYRGRILIDLTGPWN